MRFKDLNEEFKEAKYQADLADKNLRRVLELMEKAGNAKTISDGEYEIFIITSPPNLIKDITSFEMEEEDIRYFGIDEGGRAEAKEQNCDPEEFFDQIILAPGEKVDWFMKGYAGWQD